MYKTRNFNWVPSIHVALHLPKVFCQQTNLQDPILEETNLLINAWYSLTKPVKMSKTLMILTSMTYEHIWLQDYMLFIINMNQF